MYKNVQTFSIDSECHCLIPQSQLNGRESGKNVIKLDFYPKFQNGIKPRISRIVTPLEKKVNIQHDKCQELTFVWFTLVKINLPVMACRAGVISANRKLLNLCGQQEMPVQSLYKRLFLLVLSDTKSCR